MQHQAFYFYDFLYKFVAITTNQQTKDMKDSKPQSVTRTFDILDQLQSNFPQKEDILARKIQGQTIRISVSEYRQKSYSLAYALLESGYRSGDKAITITTNRPEWNFLDMGLNLAGMVHVPVYPTLNQNDFLYIFNHSDARIIFIGTKTLYNKINPIVSQMDNPAKVYLLDSDPEVDNIEQLYALGASASEATRQQVETIKQTTRPEDLATIIYTSGTTGIPKGVMLSHWNLMFNMLGHAVKQTQNSSHRMLSFLPLCHIYERTMNYEYQYLGISTYYAESLGTISRDLADFHADGFCSVPRVLEMMYSKLEAAGKDLTGIKRIIYNWAWKFGNEFDNYNHHWFYRFQHHWADRLVYRKWREKLGGHEMLIVSGGSSIQAKIVRLFNAAKLRIFEGYGMTETSPVIAVNSPVQGFNIIGTVGKPMEGTEFKFAEDGEILTRGPHVMLGYYKNPEATRETIDEEGWLHTGDIGRWVDGQYVQITDRKKEIFKLSSGKYIAPQMIENKLRESPFIENCIVFGENHKFASALIIPDMARLHFWAAKHKVTYKDNDDLVKNPKVIAKIHREIDAVNANLSSHEAIKRERLINEEWSTANNMLSQTLKLKRANILKNHKHLVDEIYANE